MADPYIDYEYDEESDELLVETLPAAVSVTLTIKHRLTKAALVGYSVTLYNTSRYPIPANTVGTTNPSGQVTFSVRPGSYDISIDADELEDEITGVIDIYTDGSYDLGLL